MTASELIWEAMLQHIINGMATKGSRKWSRITPDTAEKAKPENPDTTPPRKSAIVSNRGLNSLIVQHEILRTPRAKVPAKTYCFSPDCAARRTILSLRRCWDTVGKSYH